MKPLSSFYEPDSKDNVDGINACFLRFLDIEEKKKANPGICCYISAGSNQHCKLDEGHGGSHLAGGVK